MYMYLSLALIAASVVFASLSLVFKNNKGLRYTSYGVSVCSVFVFAVVLVFASAQYRAY